YRGPRCSAGARERYGSRTARPGGGGLRPRSGADDIREAGSTDLTTPATSADEAMWEDALDGQLPDDPAALRELVAIRAAATPLPALRRLVEALGAKEMDAGARARDWRSVRGMV